MKNLLLLVFCITCSMQSKLSAQSIIYVDSLNGNDANSGIAWTSSFKTLGKGLEYAHQTPTVEKVLVAKGTYYPTHKPFEMGVNQIGVELSTTSNFDKTFHIRQGLEVFGGYPNGGGVRDINSNPTILSGLLGGFDNAHHVVLMDTASNWNIVNDTSKLDGFTIEKGNATYSVGSNNIIVNGVSVNFNEGGGIHGSGLLNISNNRFINNYAVYGGAFSIWHGHAVFNHNIYIGNNAGNWGGAISLYDCYSEIANSVFENNISSATGGAIRAEYSTYKIHHNLFSKNRAVAAGAVSVTFSDRCEVYGNTFSENYASQNCGALYTSSIDSVFTYNNIFTSDTALVNAGALYIDGSGYYYLGNNTFNKNVAFSHGGALYIYGNIPKVSNCIFYQNKINQQSNVSTADFTAIGTSNYWFKNCIMQLQPNQYVFALSNSLYNSSNNYFNLNPIFKGGSGSDSLSLADCSPAIDAGKDSLLWNGILVDIEGNSRLHDVPYVTNINSNSIDIGAYENQSNSIGSPLSITTNFTSVQSNPPVLYNHGYFTNIAYGSPVSTNWYDASIGGNLLKFLSDTLLSADLYSTTTYYAIPAFGSCEYNGARTPVVDSISPCTTYTSLYVDSSVLLSGDGSSWGTALKTFNEALAISHACSNIQQIYVAKGTFTPSDKLYQMDINKVGTQTITPNDKDKKFHIRVGLEVFGGYPNGGGLRDIDANPTVLQGILSNGDSVEEIIYVDSSVNWATSNDSTIIDGFVIQYAKVHGVDLKMGSNRISHCTIQHNHSIYFGGGIYCSTGRNHIQSNKIINNSASSNGGGIFASNSTYNETATIVDNLIEHNSSTGAGGGIFGMYIINIKGNIIRNNSTTTSGGGILIQNMYDKSIPIEDNIISMNHADFKGGGLYFDGGSPINVIHNFIDSNSSVDDGAGIYSSGNVIRLKKCSITNNISQQEGGGLFFTNTIDTIDACKFIGNQSSIGGGLNISGTKSCIINSLIAYNKSFNDGGGGRINCGIIKFCNNTVVYNRGNSYGGAMSLIFSDAYVSNSIFWKNKTYNSETDNGADIYMPGPVSGIRFFKNNFMQLRDTQYTYTGSGIFDLGINSTCKFAIDPLFKGSAYTDSFNVVDCSMAIDAGLDNVILNLSLFDLENNNRFHDVPFAPNLGINSVDVGAYENQGMASSSPISPTLGYLQSTPSAIYGSGIFLNQAIGSSHFANWYDAPTGGTLLQQSSNIYQSPVLSSSTTYYVVGSYGLCESSSPRIPITDSVFSCNSFTNLYVDSSVAVSGNGSSWAQAFKSLSDAMAYSQSCPSIEKIYVAKGTYYPTNFSYTMNTAQVGIENISSDFKRKTFHLRTGLEMYGGYSSGGGTRNVIDNPTILEGVLPTGDSIYHVVIIDSSVNWITPNDTTILDGFIVQHGCAVGSTIEIVNGMNLLPYAGGGIYVQRGLNLLRNNIISSNRTWSYGGGIFKNIGQSFFVNNIIASNNCEYFGGGIYLSKGQSEITNNTIYANSVVHYAGGLYVDSGYHKISNTIFWNNLQQGLSNSFGSDIGLNDTNVVFTNNIFQLYKSQYFYSLGVNPTGNLFHSDPLFLGGSLGDSLSLKPCSPAIDAGDDLAINSFSQEDINLNNRFFDITYLPNSGTNTVDIGAFENDDTSSISPVSPTLTSTQVNPISIVGGGVFTNMVNGASHSINWYDAPVGGNLLFYNDSIWVSPTLTISTYYYAIPAYGRCESNQPRTPLLDSVSACLAGNIRYVDSSMTVSGDGLSWSTAFKSLSDALATAQSCILIDTIKVAKGTYHPTRKVFQMDTNQISHEINSSDNRDKTFHVRQGLNLLGGFSSGGGARDFNQYPTILDGSLNGTDTAYHVVCTFHNSFWTASNDSTKIDGFIIQNGRADSIHTYYNSFYDYYTQRGGGILNFNGPINISNCQLCNNNSIEGGGGLALWGNNSYESLITHNLFKSNKGVLGGAIALLSGHSYVDANTFIDNQAVNGGAIYINTYDNYISNNVFYNNSASQIGGAIFTYSNSFFYSNTFFANKADSNAGAIMIGNYSSMYNNIFWGNLKAGNRNIQGSDYLNFYPTTSFVITLNNIMQLPNSSYIATSSGNYDLGSNSNCYFNSNPNFVDSTNISGIDGLYQTNDDGLRLQSISNGIDNGSNFTPGLVSLQKDIRGAARIQNFMIDIGAYEYGGCFSNTFSTQILDTICSDGFYFFNGQNLNTTGSYSDTLISSGGCDSVVVLILIVNPITNEPTQFVTVYSPYTWPVNGVTYTISGVYTYTGTNSFGCSDIYTLDLLIKDAPESIQNYFNNKTVHFYPNPAHSNLNLKAQTKVGSNYRIECKDMIGRTLKVIQMQATSGLSNIELSTEDIASGLYLIQLFEDNNLFAEEKITIQH